MRNIVSDGEMMVFARWFQQPMDTSREYQLLNSLYKENKAPWIHKMSKFSVYQNKKVFITGHTGFLRSCRF